MILNCCIVSGVMQCEYTLVVEFMRFAVVVILFREGMLLFCVSVFVGGVQTNGYKPKNRAKSQFSEYPISVLKTDK